MAAKALVVDVPWTFDEVEGFYVAFLRFGTAWNAVVCDLPGRTLPEVIALHEAHREYLSMDLGLTTAAELYRRVAKSQTPRVALRAPLTVSEPRAASAVATVEGASNTPSRRWRRLDFDPPGVDVSPAARAAAVAATARRATSSVAADEGVDKPPGDVAPELNAAISRLIDTALGPAAPFGEWQTALARSLSAPVRRWAAAEFCYAPIDVGFFHAHRPFELALAQVAPQLDAGAQLTKAEWNWARARMARPRRFSRAFVSQARRELHAYRAAVRGVADGLVDPAELAAIMGVANVDAALVNVGLRVLARHPHSLELHPGVVLTTDRHQYRVQFDRDSLGIALVNDEHVVALTALEPDAPLAPGLAASAVTHGALATLAELVGALKTLARKLKHGPLANVPLGELPEPLRARVREVVNQLSVAHTRASRALAALATAPLPVVNPDSLWTLAHAHASAGAPANPSAARMLVQSSPASTPRAAATRAAATRPVDAEGPNELSRAVRAPLLAALDKRGDSHATAELSREALQILRTEFGDNPLVARLEKLFGARES